MGTGITDKVKNLQWTEIHIKTDTSGFMEGKQEYVIPLPMVYKIYTL